LFDAFAPLGGDKQPHGECVLLSSFIPNRTLQELARIKPHVDAELLEVRGIGPAKARNSHKIHWQ